MLIYTDVTFSSTTILISDRNTILILQFGARPSQFWISALNVPPHITLEQKLPYGVSALHLRTLPILITSKHKLLLWTLEECRDHYLNYLNLVIYSSKTLSNC